MAKFKITNNVLFVLAMMLIMINLITFGMSSKNMISGKASSQTGTASVCIGTTPSIGVPSPDNGAVLNGLFNTTVTAYNSTAVRFYWFYFGIPDQPFGIDYDVNNDNIFNATLNTSALPDGGCNYRIVATPIGFCATQGLNTPSGVFSINNINESPKWTEFNNSLSTNFSSYLQWINLPNSRIGVPDSGVVEFLGTSNFDGVDLDADYNISPNLIDINPSSWCMRDAEYRLTFFNSTQYVDPIVYLNGQICPASSCYNYNLSGSNLTFQTHVFDSGTYELKEGSNITLNITLSPLGINVDLNWTYTLSGPYSTPPDYYNIYIGTNATEMINFTDFGSPNITGVTDEHWTDHNANQSAERYYVVTAVKGTREARAPETGCKYDVPVYAGQNLVSLPCETRPITINKQVHPPADSYYDRYTKYVPGVGFLRVDYYGPVWKWWGFFNELENDEAYYLYPTKNNYKLTTAGLIPENNRTINVTTGLGLRGWTSVFEKNLSETLNPGDASYGNTITRYSTGKGWERVDYYGTTWKWWGWWDKFQPGYGYWYYPTAVNYTWEYDPD